MVNFIKSANELKKLSGDALLKTGELSELTGIRLSTIQYYAKIGLLPYDQEEIGLTRRFKKDFASKRLIEIQKLKDKRLTIEEIKKHFNGQ